MQVYFHIQKGLKQSCQHENKWNHIINKFSYNREDFKQQKLGNNKLNANNKAKSRHKQSMQNSIL